MERAVSEGTFDEVIHEKNRLRICGILSGVDSISFPALAQALGVSDSVLSKHLKALQEAGHVSVAKPRSTGRPRSLIALTPHGRRAFRDHVLALNAMITHVADPDSTLADNALSALTTRDPAATRNAVGGPLAPGQ
jgi:predicted ArsR family transcriptional regulator